MFDFAQFIINNLKRGYDNGSFTREQVNIFSFNYLTKGQISQEDFDAIQAHLDSVVEGETE